ncbi:transglutaminase domain-containing protein [Streptomyces sp. L7]
MSRYDPQLTKLPLGVPASLRDFAESTTEGAATPYEKATALARGLRRNSTYVPTAENDASYGAVGRFLTERRGSATAFAVAFVLAARVLHPPARVVVGFTAGKQQPGSGYVVRGSNATAWGEVKFEHLGWVAFNPLPAPSTAAPDEGSTASPSPRPATESPTPSPTASTPHATPTGPTLTGKHRGAHRPSATEVPWLQLLGAVVAFSAGLPGDRCTFHSVDRQKASTTYRDPLTKGGGGVAYLSGRAGTPRCPHTSVGGPRAYGRDLRPGRRHGYSRRG